MTVKSNQSGYLLSDIATQIAAGSTESAAIPVNAMSLVGVIVPAVFTGVALSFLVGNSADGFQASGQIVFDTNAADADTVTINGQVITFKTVVLLPTTQVEIGSSKEETAQNLQDFLEATAIAALLACTYVTVNNVVMVTAVVSGTAGNAYTFDKSSSHITLSPAAGTLTGGGFRPLYNAANSLISMTVAAGRTYAVDPANFQGLLFMKLKSGSTEVATRTLFVSLKGF